MDLIRFQAIYSFKSYLILIIAFQSIPSVLLPIYAFHFTLSSTL